MNQKAQISFKVVLILLFLSVIGFEATNIAVKFVKKDTVFKQMVLEDMEMMVNTLAGVPEDAIVKYPHNMSEYVLILRENSISMFKKEDPLEGRARKFFFLPEGYNASGVLEEKSDLCLEKERKRISLKECP